MPYPPIPKPPKSLPSSPSHVTRFLRDDRFGDDVKRVLEGLLDGSLDPNRKTSISGMNRRRKKRARKVKRERNKQTKKHKPRSGMMLHRRNVFDDEELDIARLRVGKQDVG